MTSHELAKILLGLPNLPVAVVAHTHVYCATEGEIKVGRLHHYAGDHLVIGHPTKGNLNGSKERGGNWWIEEMYVGEMDKESPHFMDGKWNFPDEKVARAAPDPVRGELNALKNLVSIKDYVTIEPANDITDALQIAVYKVALANLRDDAQKVAYSLMVECGPSNFPADVVKACEDQSLKPQMFLPLNECMSRIFQIDSASEKS